MSSKKYFITGASGGLGLELVKTVLEAGNTVVATVRRPGALSDLAEQYGDALIVEQLDVTNRDNIYEVAERHTDVDVVINNAGGAVLGAMEELSDAQVKQQLDLNLVGPINVTRAFLPALRARKGGCIVYITSVGGRVGYPSGVMYHAAKFGLEGFAEAVSQEISGFGINTIIVEPGSMKTDFQANINWTEESETYRDTVVGEMRRYISSDYTDDSISGDPVKIAHAIYDLTQLSEPPLRVALGPDTFATFQEAYARNVAELEAQKDLALSVAFEGKTGFMPGARND